MQRIKAARAKVVQCLHYRNVFCRSCIVSGWRYQREGVMKVDNIWAEEVDLAPQQAIGIDIPDRTGE